MDRERVSSAIDPRAAYEMIELKKIGFIGLGVMGEPMCRNLAIGTQSKILALDTNPDPVRRLSQNGVSAATYLKELAIQCDLIFLALPSGEQVRHVCMGKDGLLENAMPATTVVDLGTSPVSLARELSEAFEAKGVSFIDAPIARTREAAQRGTLSIMVGGRQADFDAVLPFLRFLGSDITYCGSSGAGQAMKILNNMVLMETVAALSEAVALAEHVGLSAELLFDTLSKGSADSFALRNHGMKAIARQDFPEKAFSTAYALKDLQYAFLLANEAKLDLLGARAAGEYLDRAMMGGDQDRYWPVISKYINKSRG
jgi:3-hydroxyisobutyrate dehydrogenase-like beta-hydroxyacid dehydrogenase